MGYEIETHEMGGACRAYGLRGEACTGFWWGNVGDETTGDTQA